MKTYLFYLLKIEIVVSNTSFKCKMYPYINNVQVQNYSDLGSVGQEDLSYKIFPIDKTKILMTSGSLIKVKSIAECSPGSIQIRAYPGSELVVANTLAKWKRLEPNDINFSQGFSQKVCFVFNSLLAMSADNLCKQF